MLILLLRSASSGKRFSEFKTKITDFVLFSSAKIFFKSPNNALIDWATFFKLFKIEAWIALVAIFAFVTFVWNLVYTKFELNGKLDFGLCLILPIEILSHQGIENSPSKKTSIRIILLTLLLASQVLLAFYAGNLTSFLSVNKISFPFQSLETLYLTDFEIGTIPGSNFYQMFEKSTDKIEKELFEKRYHF